MLTNNKINGLYQLLAFNSAEREEYFSLDKDLRRRVNAISKTENRIYMILFICYFKYKPIAHDLSEKNDKKDIQYIVQQYYPRVNHDVCLTISI
ncbi:DUF4158 domain-containing protein [Candidatus Pantoea persica]|uniref:DUF4158 domain-containing protein n=1 Tax=Candidatus Pantoea persica TaxID=2518128 RepID=UPI00215D63D8|nr:DUF4158 domain-containing protein [Candidatus Pantoea persica]